MSGYILGLDVGDKRVGVALANDIARLPSPYAIISPEELLGRIDSLVKEHGVSQIAVGLPLSADGSDNPQTLKIRQFMSELQKLIDIPVSYVNEAHTSIDAKNYMLSQKKLKDRRYYDDIAACYIIEEYLKGAVV